MDAFVSEEPAAVLRPVGERDVDALMQFFESLGEQSRGFFHPHPFDRRNAERICRPSEPGVFRLAARVGSRIVGYAWCQPVQDSRDCRVLGIAVSDDMHGRGLGGALLDALIAEATRVGAEVLRLTVYPDNERAVRLYRSRGFKQVGTSGAELLMDLELTKNRLGGTTCR